MIGFVIVSHGSLGESLIQCASHVMCGCPQALKALGVNPGECPSQLTDRLQALIHEVDSGDGVIIFTDIYGATPSNAVCCVMQPGRIEGISGVSLPMLVRALNYRQEPIETVIAKAMSGGGEGILQMTKEACDVAARH